MSINLDSGLWQCFKTGNKGNFLKLYSILEGVSYHAAEAEILFYELQNGKSPNKKPKKKDLTCEKDSLYLSNVSIKSYENNDWLIQKAWKFLYERKLFDIDREDFPKFYVSTDGKYSGRLVIPFESNDKIFYFQARTLTDTTPKYLNPSEGWPKSSSVLYPYDEDADHLVVCEGPLDAISLQLQNVNATCTLGCSVSLTQIDQLSEFSGKIIIGYDNDSAGKKGVNKFDYLRRIKRMAELYICHPPLEVKDWNDAHVQGFDLQSFVKNHTRKYDSDYLIDHLLTTL